MKSKKLTLILAIFFVIVVITTLCSTMFMLATIEVNFFNESSIFLGLETSIIESGEFEYGQNILLINKKKYIKNLETKNPYLRVLNIESIFPNKLVINCLERKELFYYQQSNNNYIILDKFYKVLKTVNASENLELLNGNILIEGLLVDSFNEGEKLLLSATENTKSNCIYNGLFMWSDDENYLKSKLQSVRINNDDVVITTKDNKKINIENFVNQSEDKFNLAFSIYSSGVMIENNYIKIYENHSGEIVGVVGK